MAHPISAADEGQERLEPLAPPVPDQRFQSLIEGLDAVVWEMDVGTWTFTYVSPQAERLLGYPVEHWYADSTFWPERLVHPEDREWAVPFCMTATAEGRDHEFDYRAVAADGRVVWLRDVVRVICDADGQPRLLRGVMVDVTEQKDAERELNQRVRHAALSADVGSAIAGGGTLRETLQSCAAAMVEHLDAAFARIWTLNAAEQVLELQASEGMYTHLDGPHGRVPVGKFKIGLIAEEREPHLTNEVQTDPRVGDKEWARREGMVSFAGYPLLVEGRVVGVMAMFARHPLPRTTLDALQTIADRIALLVARQQTESALREREFQLAEAQRIAHMGSWEWEVGSDRVRWSDELFRIYGLLPQSEECTVEWYLSRVHPEDRERVREVIGEMQRTGDTFEYEERIVRPDGSVRLLLSRGRAIKDWDGRIHKLVGTSQDVTAQRAAAAREVELAREQTARHRAEEEERRAAFLAEAGSVLSSSLDYATTLRSFAHLVVPRVADWCAIDILDDDGGIRRVVTAHSDPAKEALAQRLEQLYPSAPESPTGVPQVLRTGRPELIPEISLELLESAAVDGEHLRILRELQLRSSMVIPLIARGRTLGTITFVGAESGKRYGEDDLRFAQELAGRAALAVDNARLYQEAELARGQVTRVLESITDAFFAVDRHWRFSYVNSEAEALLHRRRDELLGRELWQEFPDAVGSTFDLMYRRAVDEQRTVQFEEFFPPLDTWFEVRAYPSDEGLAIYFRNINERKQAEEEVQRSEQRYRSLTEATAAIVWSTPASGEFQGSQPRWSAFTGQSAEELQGWGWLNAVHPDDRATTAQAWTLALESRGALEVEHRLRRADGEYRDMMVRAVPVLTEEGDIREWVGVHTDVTERKRAQEALQYQSSLTRTIAENATSALFLIDERGHCTFLNPAAEQMIGFALNEIRDVPLHDAIHHHHPDGSPYPMHECPIDRALPENFDIRAHRDVFIRKDGTFFPVVCAASPIFRDGIPVATVVEVRDVTEEQEAQRALEASEQQYRFLTEAVPVQIWTALPDGTLDYVSRQTAEFFGRTPEEVIGEGWQEVIHPDQLQQVGQRWLHSLQTGEPYEVEYLLRGRDGQYRWFLGRAVPLRDASGRIVRWFGSNVDIEDRKDAEQERERLIAELDRERSRLQSVYLQAPAVVAIYHGPEHVVTMVNSVWEQLTGKRNAQGRRFREIFPELEGSGLFELLDRVYETGEPFVGQEVPVSLDRRGDGRLEETYWNFVWQPLTMDDGRVEDILVHAVEVTDQVLARREVEQKAEELTRIARQLEITNRELDQFAYVASHDLKAPLRGIANLSQWIEEDLDGEINQQVRDHLDLLRGRVHRMEGLIDGVLQYSRAGRVREKPEPVAVRELLEVVVDLLAPPQDVEVRIAADMPTLVTERLPLQQVFMNLIGNAVKYVGQPKGRVEVRAETVGELVRFSVSDNGPGIAPEYHERIFGIFQTLEARDKVEGTGIGLSLVKKIVEARGGQVWVESGEGAGATFHFLWPLEASEP